jgi:Tfp pilus assembly protein PilF
LQLTDLSPQSKELAASAAIRGLVWTLLAALRIPMPTEDTASAWVRWGQQYFSSAGSRAWAGIARACRRARHWGEAFQAALQIAFEGEVSGRAWMERGVYCQLRQKDPAAAEAAFRRAIELDPADAWPWHNLGWLLDKDPQRHAEAEAAYRRAIELDPADALPWHNIGTLLDEDPQRHAEAEAAFRRAIELDPADAAPWYNLGFLLAKNPQRHAEAEAAYHRAIELDPADAWPWNNIGTLLAKNPQRHAETEAAFRRAIELAPTLAKPWHNLGNLLAQDSQRHAEAEAAYHRAIDLDPAYAWPWYNLGILLAEAPQRHAEAEAAFTRYLALKPDDSGAQWRLRELRTRRALNIAHAAISAADWPATRQALQNLHASSELQPGWTSERSFLSGVIAPTLRAGQGRWLLDTLRELGYEAIAAPLLLAIEARLDGDAKALEGIEPELRRASQQVHAELEAALSPSVAPG